MPGVSEALSIVLIKHRKRFYYSDVVFVRPRKIFYLFIYFLPYGISCTIAEIV